MSTPATASPAASTKAATPAQHSLASPRIDQCLARPWRGQQERRHPNQRGAFGASRSWGDVTGGRPLCSRLQYRLSLCLPSSEVLPARLHRAPWVSSSNDAWASRAMHLGASHRRLPARSSPWGACRGPGLGAGRERPSRVRVPGSFYGERRAACGVRARCLIARVVTTLSAPATRSHSVQRRCRPRKSVSDDGLVGRLALEATSLDRQRAGLSWSAIKAPWASNW